MTCTALTPLHSRRVMRRWLLCLCAVLALAALGCEKDAQTLTNEGNVALVGQDYDTAVTRFNEALKKDAANFDAVVGLAEVYTLKGDVRAHVQGRTQAALVFWEEPWPMLP